MRRNILILLSLLIGVILVAACVAAPQQAAPAAPAQEEAPAEAVQEEAPAEAAEEAPAEAAEEEAPAEAAAPEGEFNWRMFEGQQIRVAMVTQPWSQFLEPLVPEFEELTGIDVTYEILPEDQFRQKTTVEFTAGTSDVDVFLSMVAQEGIKYESAGWYADMEALINDPSITDPEFDFADFSEQGLAIARLSNGKLIGLPVYNEFGALFYNKALFDQAGVAYPPTTLEEVEAAAAAIHNPDEGVYGICLRGKGAAATSQFSSILHAFGSDWVDAEGNSNILDPKFMEAINWYGGMLNKYGPPGATSYHWAQCQDVFLQGKAGMWIDASVFFANLIDPEQSTIVDNVGVTMSPEGPAGRTPYIGGWHLSIYNGSDNVPAAWLFVQWALSKELVLRAQLENITTGRVSAWEAEEFTSQNKYPEFATTTLEALEIGNPNWNPPVLGVSEARDAVGVLIIEAIEGGDVETTATETNDIVQGLLDETPQLQ
jgi:multiple sugar transport system substrate-binding protein